MRKNYGVIGGLIRSGLHLPRLRFDCLATRINSIDEWHDTIDTRSGGNTSMIKGIHARIDYLEIILRERFRAVKPSKQVRNK